MNSEGVQYQERESVIDRVLCSWLSRHGPWPIETMITFLRLDEAVQLSTGHGCTGYGQGDRYFLKMTQRT